MPKANCLVTGGAGFIGSSIVRLLLSKGYSVTVVDDLSCGTIDHIEGIDIDFIKTDVSAKDFPEKLKGMSFEYIFNFGSYSSDRYFSLDGVAVEKTIKGLFNVSKVAQNTHAKSVVYPSSGTIYGNSTPPQKEDSLLSPKSMYACTKLFLENYCATLIDETKYTALRIFTGYGEDEIYKGDIASVVTLFYRSIIEGIAPTIYGNGEQKRDFVYVDDIAEAALHVAESSFEGNVNVGSGSSTSFNELIHVLNSKLGTEVVPRYIDSPIAWVDETRADLTKLKDSLGLKPMGIEKGIERYIARAKKIR